MLITLLTMLITFFVFSDQVYIIFLKNRYFFTVFINFFNTVLKLFFIYYIILKNVKNMTVEDLFFAHFQPEKLLMFFSLQICTF